MYNKIVGVMLCVFALSSYATEDLAKSNTCLACHTVEKKLVGPAFKAVAAKYSQIPGSDEILFNKIRIGGSGVWGAIPMPPMGVSVKENDIKKIVAWILTLK